MKICPACRHQNREGYMFCEDCGEDITQIESTPDYAEINMLEPGIIIQVQGETAPIMLPLAAHVTLGRFDSDRSQQPDIDLNSFEAFEKGISVVHAAIHHDDDGVKIMDVGSKNGTYVNGRRLIPQQYYMLRDGDEIRLSRLIAYVYLKGIE